MGDPREERAVALLRGLGAERVTHPGGALPAHLGRVRDLLGAWGARPELRLAGLCHAVYGTDGFPAALLPLGRRAEVAEAVGAEAERLAYVYASCDRGVSYPGLGAQGVFRDRFTGEERRPGGRGVRDFAELTAANELDLARTDPVFREARGGEPAALFRRWEGLLSEPARRECRAVLGG
ncbi:DUF6817 domain-containing protein [Streptomyces sp. 2P-4]|uniref:DUF6817 domain-containing protein n=1 Tax=Streptomyces sp. 2P-4 TaxID=2931974 RepID=UPI0025423DCE|nr:hypothetical protein [Streptomyces sp. 2P-4]